MNLWNVKDLQPPPITSYKGSSFKAFRKQHPGKKRMPTSSSMASAETDMHKSRKPMNIETSSNSTQFNAKNRFFFKNRGESHTKQRPANISNLNQNYNLSIDEQDSTNNKLNSKCISSKKSYKSKTNSSEKNEERTTKKPFDKKQWRLQKYNKKYKLEQWEEKRKQFLLKNYHREVKNDAPTKFDIQKIYEENEESNSLENTDELEDENTKSEITSNERHPKYKKKGSWHLKDEKLKMKEDLLKKREERDNAMKLYKEKKMQKFKKLNKKTKKGQPIMKHRIEMLLEQIEKSVAQ